MKRSANITQRLSHLYRLIVSVLLLMPSTAVACTPAPPTPWFIEQLTADTISLPTGVTLNSINPTTIALTNRSPTPLYVLGKLDGRNEQSYETLSIALPDETGPLHRLVSGQVFTWRSDAFGSDRSPRFRWLKDRYAALLLDIDPWSNSITTGEGSIAEIKQLNRTGDNRPIDVVIPQPQQTELTLVHDNQLLPIPLTVSYKLNESYDPYSVARSLSACNPRPSPLTLGFLFTASIVLFIVIMRAIVRRFLHRS